MSVQNNNIRNHPIDSRKIEEWMGGLRRVMEWQFFGGIRLPRVLRAMVECIAAVTLAEICLFGTNKDGNVTET